MSIKRKNKIYIEENGKIRENHKYRGSIIVKNGLIVAREYALDCDDVISWHSKIPVGRINCLPIMLVAVDDGGNLMSLGGIIFSNSVFKLILSQNNFENIFMQLSNKCFEARKYRLSTLLSQIDIIKILESLGLEKDCDILDLR